MVELAPRATPYAQGFAAEDPEEPRLHTGPIAKPPRRLNRHHEGCLYQIFRGSIVAGQSTCCPKQARGGEIEERGQGSGVAAVSKAQEESCGEVSHSSTLRGGCAA